jgi:hypothetical protein
MDTIVNPFKQASRGIVKGVSSLPSNVFKGVTKIGDGLTIVSDSVVENAGKIFRTNLNNNNNNNNNRMNFRLNKYMQTFPIVEEPQAEVKERFLLKYILNIYIIECEKYSTSSSTCYYG